MCLLKFANSYEHLPEFTCSAGNYCVGHCCVGSTCDEFVPAEARRTTFKTGATIIGAVILGLGCIMVTGTLLVSGKMVIAGFLAVLLCALVTHAFYLQGFDIYCIEVHTRVYIRVFQIKVRLEVMLEAFLEHYIYKALREVLLERYS